MTSDASSHPNDESSSLVQQMWWYKPLVWGLLVVLLYLLREFFLIGFLTFLFCFVVRSCVGFLTRRISPDRDDRRLDLILTLSIFLVICLTLFGLGRYFVPHLFRQGKSLVAQMQNLSANQVQNTLLVNTVGSWEFENQFGSPGDPRYKKGLSDFEAAGRSGEGLYEEFPKLLSRVKAEFELSYEQAQLLHLQSQGMQGDSTGADLESWFLAVKAPELFQEKSDYYISRWQAEQVSNDQAGQSTPLNQQPDFESQRDEQIRRQIWTDIRSDPVLYTQFKNQWDRAVSIRKWDAFRQRPEYQDQFKKFYEGQFNESPKAVPIDYATFQTLAVAYPKGKQAFLTAFRLLKSKQQESPAHQRYDFETAKKLEFGRQWWVSSPGAHWIRGHVASDGPSLLEGVVKHVDDSFGAVVRIPIQIVTALLLAVFMLIEWHSMKTGVADLRNTRVRPIVDEVVPGVVTLGKLIGKSFQGQVLIAVFNAGFTLFALWLIGVEYKFVLALVVFVFSFIPVLGVILSGIPICAIALLQPGGSLVMAVQVIIAMAIIHLIEGMILSPRIIGKIGHLHPVLVIAILLISEHFFGMWGLVLGVPVAIYIIRVVILRLPIPGIYDPCETEPVPREPGELLAADASTP